MNVVTLYIAHCTRLCTLNQIPLHTLFNTHIIFLTCYINSYICFNEIYMVCIICCRHTSNGCTQIISCSVTGFYYKFAILVNNQFIIHYNHFFKVVDFFRSYYDSEDHIYVILFQHTA